jgi:hypothetical protein
MATRYIIACAGSNNRWMNYTGVPKHLVLIDKRPLLHHTISGLQDRGATDIIVLAKTPGYSFPGVLVRDPQESALESTALGHSAAHWGEDRTTLLLGDVYFSSKAFDLVTTSTGCLEWFGREGQGKSGSQWGELFAVSFNALGQDKLRDAFRIVARAKQTGRITRAGGWECYRYLHDIPLKEHRITEDFFEINDETEDFDTPWEYDNWLKVFRPNKS